MLRGNLKRSFRRKTLECLNKKKTWVGGKQSIFKQKCLSGWNLTIDLTIWIGMPVLLMTAPPHTHKMTEPLMTVRAPGQFWQPNLIVVTWNPPNQTTMHFSATYKQNKRLWFGTFGTDNNSTPKKLKSKWTKSCLKHLIEKSKKSKHMFI